MASRGEVGLALLQEAGDPPGEIADRFRYENDALEPTSFDRRPLVVQLSDKVEVEWFRQVPALGWWRDEREIEVSGSGTLAVARVVPCGQTEEAFLAVSMYARWTRAHPSTTVETPGRHADISVHRILSNLQSFMDYLDPSHYPMLAAGDLNLCYGATEAPWYARERVVWDRFKALGLEFLGLQLPNERAASSTPLGQLRGHAGRSDLALQPPEAGRDEPPAGLRLCLPRTPCRRDGSCPLWRGGMGASDHCRLLLEVGGT